MIISADPNVAASCWIKRKMGEPNTVIGKYSARRVRYDCKDNHNCGSSFVEIRDHNLGQGVGQERHYCGHETPPQFFSYGPNAQVITSLDSDPGNVLSFILIEKLSRKRCFKELFFPKKSDSFYRR